MPTESPLPKPRFLRWRWFIVVLVVAVSLALFFYLRRDQPIEAERAQQNIVLKNQSLAHLENLELKEAAEGFRSLSQTLPDEPLGLRNLAVTQLLQVSELDPIREPDELAAAVTALKSSLSKLLEFTPEDAVVHLLSARLNDLLEKPDAAIPAYLKAAELDDLDSVPLYRAFQLMQQRPESYPVTDREQAIASAWKRNPENLALVLAYLKFLAETQNARFSETLSDSRTLFTPFASRLNGVLPKLLSEATTAAKADDWPTVNRSLVFIGNVLLAEIAFTHDLNQLNPHPLEYVVTDFSPAFYEQSAPLRGQATNPVTVEFSLSELKLPQANSGITAMEAADLNLDGKPELLIATESTLRAYALPVPELPLFSVELARPVTGIQAADLDRDYQNTREEAVQMGLAGFLDTDLDLVVWGADGVQFFENVPTQEPGVRTLREKMVPREIQKLVDVHDIATVDLDHDGDLDLAISSARGLSLWSNRGDWTFEDFSPYSQVPGPERNVRKILPVDLDRNVLNDFLLAGEAESGLTVLRSNLHGRYVSRTCSTVTEPVSDLAILDHNRDATWDVVTAGKSGVNLIEGIPVRNGGWKARKRISLSKTPAVGIATWDYNNDGLDDCVAWGEQGVEIWMGTENHQLILQKELTTGFSACENVVVADADDDGDQDLLLFSAGTVLLARNDGGNANHWIDVRLRAEEFAQFPRERCNMHGVGSLLELKSGGVYQSRIVRGPSTHFGLGQKSAADVCRVVWPNGVPHNILAPQRNKVIFEQQHLKGSCPYLYTWNGTRFVFATDCLWASPIGLQFAQGVLAPAREWEYLKLSGDQLQPKDSEYILQMTEELWEAAYYDSVKLMAVDHPADVQVFSNEKVGPAGIAPFRIHTVQHPRQPVSVVDQRGRDVSEQTHAVDGNYTQTWKKSYTQGLTETHWLEIDLGKLEQPKSVKLFLTGWVFPTDTSLNIAISQNPDKPRPKPPALFVPDEQGEWREVSSYVGFPGGKTKTIVLDLTDQFLTDDYRLRIVTNMEIRWDHLFFTVDEHPAEYRLTDLQLLDADLHFRGFSARVSQPRHAPEDYNYNEVTRKPLWPPMGGNFTRYGSVTELINEADDLQVVMGAGDEMTVRFAVPDQSLPQGWVRDFILYNIGWDKDADLNTVQGQQVEPLPFRRMKSYPYEPEQSFPDTPKHRAFLRDWQTRHQSLPKFRTDIRDWSPSTPR